MNRFCQCAVLLAIIVGGSIFTVNNVMKMNNSFEPRAVVKPGTARNGGIANPAPDPAAEAGIAGDDDKLVGRWDNALSDRAYLRLNADGTFKDVSLLGSKEGKYRILSKGVMELEWPGVVYGKNAVELKYRIDGDTLEVKLAGEWVKYKRVK